VAIAQAVQKAILRGGNPKHNENQFAHRPLKRQKHPVLLSGAF